MKKNIGNSIRVGVFVFAAVLIFIVAIYYIGEKQQLFNKTFRISGVFKDVNGLQVGNNVRFAGTNVGTIENVKIISDTAVKVDMIIDEEVRRFIKKNAEALIGSDGLMGNQLLIITPGTIGQPEINNNDVIKTEEPVKMEAIMGHLKTTTENAMTISNDLAAIMSNIRAGRGAVGKLLMDKAIGEELDQSIVNIKEGTGGFKQNMDAASHSFLLRPFLKDKDKEKENEIKAKEKQEREDKKKKENTMDQKKNKKEGWLEKMIKRD